ncbi:sorting nexin 2A [Actinidia rufa]|uniref:Sorting nexin 2A n=1 Tax=Actinidia rufa TaxID=165716 RepID=A0A7J0GW47_9ERIC|nr:sorting nexin 2A [Actinidia rufa]
MMGYANDGYQEAHLFASREELETLVVDDPPPPLHSRKNPNSSLNSILQPPSYADAVFRSFDGFRTNTSVEPSSSSTSEYLRISVSEPQKQQELSNSLVPGGNTYYTYLITTRTNMAHFHGTEFSVRRRFKEVVTLSDRLSDSFRGFFIPIRPDKGVVEGQVMQKQEFVEQRKEALEKVQGRLPLARTTDVASRMLDGAVRLPRQLLGAVVDVNEVAQPAKGGRDLLRILKELKQSVVNDWSGTRPPVVEEDTEFLERKEKLQEFEQQLSDVSLQAELMVKAQQDIGETMGKLGLAFVKMTKFETVEAVYNSQRERAADMKNVATATVKASRLYRDLNAHTVKHLAILHEYLGVMLAVNNAFSDRSSALLTVQTLLSDLSSLNSRIEKLGDASSKIFGGDRSRIRKIEELKETVRVTENAKNCAIREYERIKENNKNELERLDKERRVDFLRMLKGFVVNQVGYAEKMAEEWETVAEATNGYAKILAHGHG